VEDVGTEDDGYKWAGLPAFSDAIKIKSTNGPAEANAPDRTEVYFAAAVDMSTVPGSYVGTVLITAIPNVPELISVDFTVANGSQGVVDFDENMIPVRYTGDTSDPEWVKADSTINSTAGTQDTDWFDYDARQWANAVTVTSASLSAYKAAATGTVIDEDDVLGYWVYIPRYAYEVQRRDAVDKPVCPNNEFTGSGNTLACSNTTNTQSLFDIRFETKTAGIKMPAATCSAADGSDHKDYRTECNLNRTYLGQSASYTATDQNATTWATHPAFWWDKDNDGARDSDEELNGIWVGKYETTGSLAEPTIKPSLDGKPMKSQVQQHIGVQFVTVRDMGPNDGDSGAYDFLPSYGTNYHNFALTETNLDVHQQKNTEWGAAAYLSTSIYGVGPANPKVQNNSYFNISLQDGNGNIGYGVTGCGPASDGSDDEQTTACSQYYTTLGQLASTTQNVYGIYDMVGGAYEYVMGNRTTKTTGATSNTSYMKTSPQLKYLNLYGVGIELPNILGTGSLAHSFGTQPSWSSGSDEYLYNYDVCTWETCGGQALSETTAVQSVSYFLQAWSSEISSFADSGMPWFRRGGLSFFASDAGVFAALGYDGIGEDGDSFRASLVGL
jgi:hypothetical protein